MGLFTWKRLSILFGRKSFQSGLVQNGWNNPVGIPDCKWGMEVTVLYYIALHCIALGCYDSLIWFEHQLLHQSIRGCHARDWFILFSVHSYSAYFSNVSFSIFLLYCNSFVGPRNGCTRHCYLFMGVLLSALQDLSEHQIEDTGLLLSQLQREEDDLHNNFTNAELPDIHHKSLLRLDEFTVGEPKIDASLFFKGHAACATQQECHLKYGIGEFLPTLTR